MPEMVDDAQEDARLLVRGVLLVEELGGVAERLEEHDPFHVTRQLRRRVRGAEQVDAERCGDTRRSHLPCQSTQLRVVRGGDRAHAQNALATICVAPKNVRVNSTASSMSNTLHV